MPWTSYCPRMYEGFGRVVPYGHSDHASGTAVLQICPMTVFECIQPRWGASCFERIAKCDSPALADAGRGRNAEQRPSSRPGWHRQPEKTSTRYVYLIGRQVDRDRSNTTDRLHNMNLRRVVRALRGPKPFVDDFVLQSSFRPPCQSGRADAGAGAPPLACGCRSANPSASFAWMAISACGGRLEHRVRLTVDAAVDKRARFTVSENESRVGKESGYAAVRRPLWPSIHCQ